MNKHYKNHGGHHGNKHHGGHYGNNYKLGNYGDKHHGGYNYNVGYYQNYSDNNSYGQWGKCNGVNILNCNNGNKYVGNGNGVLDGRAL